MSTTTFATSTSSTELTATTLAIRNDLRTTQELLNLRTLLKNYEYLLNKATGFTGLQLAKGELVFHGLDANNDAHKLLVDFIVKFATSQKQVRTRETLRPNNERFAFRTWLIRLGWKGRETTKLRVGLYKNLTGNSAFCTESSKTRWLEKHGTKKN